MDRDNKKERSGFKINIVLMFTLAAAGILVLIVGVDSGMGETKKIPFSIAYVSVASNRWDIWMIDENNAKPIRLSQTFEDERTPSWSGDRKKIIYSTSQGNLYIVNLENRHIEKLNLATRMNSEPAWSKDNETIAYVSYTKPREYKSELWTIHLKEETITTRRVPAPDGLITYPGWTPDGDLIYSRFVKLGSMGAVENIYRYNLKTEKEETIIEDGFDNFQAAWSPDGKCLAYTSNRTGNFDIWIYWPDQDKTEQITKEPALDTDPTWSPDSRKIAFVSARTGVQQIWIANLETGEERQVTNSDYGSRDPAWW